MWTELCAPARSAIKLPIDRGYGLSQRATTDGALRRQGRNCPDLLSRLLLGVRCPSDRSSTSASSSATSMPAFASTARGSAWSFGIGSCRTTPTPRASSATRTRSWRSPSFAFPMRSLRLLGTSSSSSATGAPRAPRQTSTEHPRRGSSRLYRRRRLRDVGTSQVFRRPADKRAHPDHRGDQQGRMDIYLHDPDGVTLELLQPARPSETRNG